MKKAVQIAYRLLASHNRSNSIGITKPGSVSFETEKESSQLKSRHITFGAIENGCRKLVNLVRRE